MTETEYRILKLEVLINGLIDPLSFSHGLKKLGGRTDCGLFPTAHDRHAGDNNPWSDGTFPTSKRWR